MSYQINYVLHLGDITLICKDCGITERVQVSESAFDVKTGLPESDWQSLATEKAGWDDAGVCPACATQRERENPERYLDWHHNKA